MYHCHVRLYFIGRQNSIFEYAKETPPFEHFTHEFTKSAIPDKSLSAESDVIFADLRDMDAAENAKALVSWKKDEAELILIINSQQLAELDDIIPEITDVWTTPASEALLKFRFSRWQKLYKKRVDSWQTEHYLEAAINSVPNLVWYKDKNGIHEKVNDSFCRVVNKTKAQVEGRGHAYIWDVEQDDPACIESERIVMEKKETCVSEETIQTGDGPRLLTTYKSPLYDWDGSVMGTVGVAIDSTKEHIYAQELTKKNQDLETLFTTMDCGVMSHSTDGTKVISINRAALNILGYKSKEELMADGFHLIAASVMDEDKGKVREKITSLKEPGDNANIEYRVCHKDGSVLYVSGNIKLVEENGERYYQRYLLDCTAQKLYEAHKRKQDEQHHTELLHALSIDYNLVCYFDLNTEKGQILQASGCKNNILQSIFTGTLSLDDCMNKYIDRCIVDEDKELMRHALSGEHLKKELLEKKLYSANYRTECCGETRYFLMKAVRTGEWKENRGVVLGFCSVDKEVRSEMEKRGMLESALAQANQANKAKSTFLSNMSHDIRTPMNAIIGFTSLAISHIDRKEQVEEYLQKIETSGKHLLDLINDVLDMSHIESGKVRLDEQPCNISSVMQELHSIIQADANAKQLDLHIDCENVLNKEIYCDVLRLNQILLNLMSNAIKYTNPGGTVSLRIIEKACELDGFSNYEFHVKDNGIGMSEDFVSHIFEPFERERNSTVSGITGTGLGMAITKNIVDMMRGTIAVKSKQGVGTECIVCLTLRLNSVASEEKTVKEAGEPKAKASAHTGRILLVEDNYLNQEIAAAILEDAGFRTETAENGQIAVDMLKNSEPGYYKLVLMDIQMPVMNGYEATIAIRKLDNKQLASIPILAMTANAFEEDRQEALRAGMDGHISKPIDIDKLINTLDKIIK